KVAVKPGGGEPGGTSERVKVFLRIRPLTDSERGEEQGCVAIQDEETLLLKAPNEKVQGRLYGAMDLKPVMSQDVRQLDTGEIEAEEIRRNSLLKEVTDVFTTRRTVVGTPGEIGIGGLSSTTHTATQLEDTDSVCLDPDSLSLSGGSDLEEGVQFSIWVSFYEIYNEFLYDLLDASPSQQPRKRVTLRLSDDKQGNPYVVPFRDSKLTRVLQGFFCGRGTSCMVVNINPCTSIYDETLQALKFSAIATQLVHGPSTKTRVAYILSLLREPAANKAEGSLMEEEEDESDVEDGDITFETLEAERALIEERYEDKISNLQKHLKKFYNQELKERDQEIEALAAALEEKRKEDGQPATAPLVESEGPRRSHRISSQTELNRLRAELDQSRAELLTKTQELVNLRMKLEVPGSAGTLTTAADRKLQEGQR
ncbi:hypothetical protein XENOCAPTIV_002860, partial [Xenoophorus captivus]